MYGIALRRKHRTFMEKRRMNYGLLVLAIITAVFTGGTVQHKENRLAIVPGVVSGICVFLASIPLDYKWSIGKR